MTDEEYAAARAAVDEEAGRRAQEAADAHAAKVKPFTDLVGSEEWAKVRDALAAVEQAALGEPYWLQVNALRQLVGVVDTMAKG